MKKNKIIQIILIMCSMIIVLLSPTVFYNKITTDSYFSPQEYQGIIRLWHIDTFEGGKGSRAEFLSKRALEYENKNSGQLILVSNHTIESAKTAFKKGEYPDLISYGVGFEDIALISYPLNNLNFKGGNILGESYAYPWCYGSYAIFSFKSEIDLDNLSGKAVFNSSGGITAAALQNIKLDYDVKEPIDAYVDFINGKYDYLIGTQRDICRFQSRNLNIYMQPLNYYSDLYQYISLLTKDTVKSAIAKKFINYLLSSNSQKKLTALSMMSADNKIYTDNENMRLLENANITSTISAFIEKTSLSNFYSNAVSALDGNSDAVKKIKNILIYI